MGCSFFKTSYQVEAVTATAARPESFEWVNACVLNFNGVQMFYADTDGQVVEAVPTFSKPHSAPHLNFLNRQHNMAPFNYSLDYKTIDFRKHPERYRVGKGEQGVLLVEPYKSEILPYWRFKDPVIAKKSADKIYGLFLDYKRKNDFVGMDMARKFLQMGYTRSRRYANHKSGKKWEGPVPGEKKGVSGAHGRPLLPLVEDAAKAACAEIFREKWHQAKEDETYKELMRAHKEMHEKEHI
jgi:hypothetical protein